MSKSNSLRQNSISKCLGKNPSQSNYPHIQEIFWASEVAQNMFWSVITLVLNQTAIKLKKPVYTVIIYVLFHYLMKEIKEQNINSQKRNLENFGVLYMYQIYPFEQHTIEN